LNVGAGFAQAAGNERSNLNQGWNFHAGGGFALTPPPAQGHKWSLFLTANFMFDQMGIKQTALQQARVMNPTDIGLLEATSGKAKFYSTTLDPTFRIPVRGRFSLYLFAGFGWFRRDLEFTGSSSQGALLQPGSPVVFGNGGNSGAYDAGRCPASAGAGRFDVLCRGARPSWTGRQQCDHAGSDFRGPPLVELREGLTQSCEACFLSCR
jgi:hypothetical protein